MSVASKGGGSGSEPTSGQPEPLLWERVGKRPRAHPGRVRELGLRDLGIRFVAGGLTSIVAGVITLTVGPRVGGVMLAFPAILAASLTLIVEEGAKVDAREDARGATLGGLGMGAFAGVAAVALPGVAGSLALVLATAAWALVAVGGYMVFWR